MRLGRGIGVALRGVLPAALLALWLSGPAAADSLQVQPDGKIVLTGNTWPGFAALARLEPDGAPDPGFGEGGFVVDRRMPPLTALALQPDGRILAGGVAGFQLARYLPDGTPDPGFAGGGVGGSSDPEQPDFVYEDYGPNAIVVRPQGDIVVAGTQQAGRWNGEQAVVRRYDSSGTFLEEIGQVQRGEGEPSPTSSLGDLLEASNGGLVGAGGISPRNASGRVLLGRFLPGSDTDFDPSFGGGVGLVQTEIPKPPDRQFFFSGASAIAESDGKLLVAGHTSETFLLARYSLDGILDSGFGDGGFVTPPIVGPGDAASTGAAEGAASAANALAVAPDGDVVLGGGSSQWSRWNIDRFRGVYCTECPQPLLARFDAEGHLDPGFGSGGLLRLLAPDGGSLEGEVEDVVALADGKLLVKGTVPHPVSGIRTPFVARLNPDGGYDRSFGDGGLTVLTFPCMERSYAQLLRESCLPSIEATVRVRRLRSGRPGLFLRVRPVEPWARLRSVAVEMPNRLRPRPGFKARTRVAVLEGGVTRGEVSARRTKKGSFQRHLTFHRLGLARELRARLGAGALEVLGIPPRHPRLSFRLDVRLAHDGSPELGSRRTLIVSTG